MNAAASDVSSNAINLRRLIVLRLIALAGQILAVWVAVTSLHMALPLRPLKRWDDGRDVLLAGDAAGLVAPASGEGIYYAMASGRLAAEAVEAALATGDARALARARARFMKQHGKVFLILRIMQHFWYATDRRRERFVSICRDPDVQRLTWSAYLEKDLGRPEPMAHLRIMMKDLAHLFGIVTPWGRSA